MKFHDPPGVMGTGREARDRADLPDLRWLEAVVERELEDTGTAEGSGDLAEVGRRDGLIPDQERGVVEDVPGVHADIDGVAFGNPGAFEQAEIERGVPGTV